MPPSKRAKLLPEEDLASANPEVDEQHKVFLTDVLSNHRREVVTTALTFYKTHDVS